MCVKLINKHYSKVKIVEIIALCYNQVVLHGISIPSKDVCELMMFKDVKLNQLGARMG